MKLFTRAAPSKRPNGSGKKTKRRLGLKLTLAALVLAGGFGLVAFYGVWAQTYVEALEGASGGPIAEGSVGGGTGMVTYEFKGGTGTASRVLEKKSGGYTVVL